MVPLRGRVGVHWAYLLLSLSDSAVMDGAHPPLTGYKGTKCQPKICISCVRYEINPNVVQKQKHMGPILNAK